MLFVVLSLLALTTILLIITATPIALRFCVWQIRYPFLILNYALWLTYDPFRCWTFCNKDQRARTVYLVMTPLRWFYWILYWFISLFFRVICIFYFSVVLFGAVSFCDQYEEVINPKLKRMRAEHTKSQYLKRWLKEFLYRFFSALWVVTKVVIIILLIIPIEILIPHFTMFHGTKFEGACTDIMLNGRWFIGDGTHVGRGVYLAIKYKPASYYSGENPACVIMCRVALTSYRNSNTFNKTLKSYIGRFGSLLNDSLKKRHVFTEHWRDSGVLKKWFEYCYLSDKRPKYLSTWRIRPISYQIGHSLQRTWGGANLWCGGKKAILGAILCWLIIGLICYLVHWYTGITFSDFMNPAELFYQFQQWSSNFLQSHQSI